MLTPLDIQNKEFKKAMRGYKETEVDSFLDEIIADYEKIYRENIELKDKIASLNEEIEKYTNLEETLKNTLIVAQNTAEEVTANARKESELIIKEAKDTARNIIEDAHREAAKIQNQYENLKKETLIYKNRFINLLTSELETIERYFKEIEKEK